MVSKVHVPLLGCFSHLMMCRDGFVTLGGENMVTV